MQMCPYEATWNCVGGCLFFTHKTLLAKPLLLLAALLL
eukprot:COSAG05_NODE_16339_length_348_cov_0.831325_1_plen_37_part_01